MQCVANILFLTLEQVLVELRVLVCIDLRTSMLTGKFCAPTFVLPQEVASLSQQARIAVAQRACEVFSIE